MRITVGRRIWLGFGSLILLTLIVLFLTNRSANISRKIYGELSTIYNPSLQTLNELSFKLEQSKILINYWAYVESKSDIQEKQRFQRIIQEEIPAIKSELDTLATRWEKRDQQRKIAIYGKMDELMVEYEEIQLLLPDFTSYQDLSWFMARDMAEEGGPIYKKAQSIEDDLQVLVDSQRDKEKDALERIVAAFATLQFYATYIGGFLILTGLIIGLLTARSIVTPVQRLKEKLLMLGKGVLPPKEERVTNDEIGEMSAALNNLIKGQKSIRQFVNALGGGEFTVHYQPLSQDDELAPDFIKTRDALAENERITEMKIAQRTRELEEKNKQINEQSKRVISLYQDLKDSIEYAKRLQDSILPTNERMKQLFPDSYVYYQPKDIVSGDFYWVEEREDWVYVAAVDCTGHGVPGAFMSLIGHNALNLAMDEADVTDPGSILSSLNRFATDSLNRNRGRTTVRDGMDVALCALNRKTHELRFSGAMRPLLAFVNGEETRLRGDRVSIGSIDQREHQYTTHSIQLEVGDTFYLFSDGYTDQFGGQEKGGKKYKQAKFISDIESGQEMDMASQRDQLRFNMMSWQGNHPQVDDMLVIGVRVK